MSEHEVDHDAMADIDVSPKAARAGRIELTDEQIIQVEGLAAFLTIDQIAEFLGIAPRTFKKIMDRDERVRARYKRGKARAIASIAQTLIKQAKAGNVACIIFFLKTQAGWRETERLEHTGVDGGPIETADAAESARAKLLQLFARKADAGRAGTVEDV